RFDNTYHDKPWLSAYNRFYTNREWAHTTKVGFSCRTYHTLPSNTTKYVAAHFFEYIPESATTVKPTTTPPFDGVSCKSFHSRITKPYTYKLTNSLFLINVFFQRMLL